MKDNKRVFLAFDLGATSWRAALGHEGPAGLQIEEVYRQTNGPVERDGGLFWDVDKIFAGMKLVLRDVAKRNIEPAAIGIDSWSIDYGLFDAEGRLLETPRSYRDLRNIGMAEKIAQRVGADYLFGRTGLMAEDITTLCQLMAAKEQTPELLEKAVVLLWIPDVLRFWLCGEQATDFTLATTGQLYNLSEGQWDKQLMAQLELPSHFLPRIVKSCSVIGHLSEQLQSETGLGSVPIVTGASHDTGAAFAAAEAEEDSVILSSGTWSIIGVNTGKPLTGVKIDSSKFGYEGNVDGTVRLISNVPGMYLLEKCRAEWEQQSIDVGHGKLVEDARNCAEFQSTLDPFWEGFVNPEKMAEAIASYCRQNGQAVPQTPGEYARTIFQGLARGYADAIEQLRELTGRPLETLVVIGGGSQNSLLNELTAEAAAVTVRSGCVEASITGNIMSQQQALRNENK